MALFCPRRPPRPCSVGGLRRPAAAAPRATASRLPRMLPAVCPPLPCPTLTFGVARSLPIETPQINFNGRVAPKIRKHDINTQCSRERADDKLVHGYIVYHAI